MFIRTDLSLAQQIVQSCHATLEAGLKDNNRYAQTSSIILIQVKNQQELLEAFERVQSLGIECVSFYEPYEDTGYTSFSTLPVGEEMRHHFKKYPLWGRAVKGEKTPLTEFLKEEMRVFHKSKNLMEQLA